jgi:hypothetical protein
MKSRQSLHQQNTIILIQKRNNLLKNRSLNRPRGDSRETCESPRARHPERAGNEQKLNGRLL